MHGQEDTNSRKNWWCRGKNLHGNTIVNGDQKQSKSVGLMRLTSLMTALSTGLLVMAYMSLMKGWRHLISLGSPFLKSSNVLACFWNIASIDSAELHASISEASWWFWRSFPVFLEYSTRAASKIAWKLEEVPRVGVMFHGLFFFSLCLPILSHHMTAYLIHHLTPFSLTWSPSCHPRSASSFLGLLYLFPLFFACQLITRIPLLVICHFY